MIAIRHRTPGAGFGEAFSGDSLARGVGSRCHAASILAQSLAQYGAFPWHRRLGLRRDRSSHPLCLKIARLLMLVALLLRADASVRGEPQEGSEPDSHSPLLEIRFQDEARPPLLGEKVTQNAKYGLLVLTADGELIAVPPSEPIASITELESKLEPTPAKDLARKVLELMPEGAKSIVTEHFVIAYDTTDVYARWNANLYERMYKGMMRFWREKGIELEPPRFPMVALIFSNQADYVNYSKRDFRGGENTFGYYTQTTNRLATFDLTGIEGMLPPGVRVQREELITEIFSRPQAERQVATILHEACHQIAFNTGLQRRLGDYPLWLSEGIATFFESPDFSSSSGWGGTGKINWFNLNNLRIYARQRPADSLMKLLVQDDLLRIGETTTNAYAESWGLTFYLIKRKPKQFVEYLKRLHARMPGNPSDAKQRLDDFRSCFGEDLDKLDKEFVRFVGTLR